MLPYVGVIIIMTHKKQESFLQCTTFVIFNQSRPHTSQFPPNWQPLQRDRDMAKIWPISNTA